MGNAPQVKIEIDRLSTSGTFTNYDNIRGTVTLIVTSAISLNYIQVKLEGVSKTQLRIPGGDRDDGWDRRNRRNRGNGERREKLLQDVHKALYDTVIVFPPDNIRQVSQAKEFTLTPGNYTYPFEFKLPLNNSCVKLQGITNKVLFTKSRDLIINNGNFSTNTLRNMAQNYVSGPQQQQQQQQQHQNYHIVSQLPPSLSGMGDFASIKYFVKVTCKRSSFLKTNLRSADPFIFLPLDLDSHNMPLLQDGDYEEYREVFVRKDLLFSNRIPDVVGLVMPSEKKPLPQVPNSGAKKGLFLTLMGSSTNMSPAQPTRSSAPNAVAIEEKDVPFEFEVRFRHPAFLIPTKAPSFKLYFMSRLKPSRYSLSQYGSNESNGLGIIYLQKLIIELTTTTMISVLETDRANDIHKAKHEEPITICNNAYKNLKFDLKDCRSLKSSSATSNAASGAVYELEIPKRYYENCVLPDYVSPSFNTCNISRSYRLSIVAGVSSEKIADLRDPHECERKIQYVDLQCADIKVLGGLNMTSTLHTNASTPSLPKRPVPSGPSAPSYDFPPDVKNPDAFSATSPSPEVAPTYPPRLLQSERRASSAVSEQVLQDDLAPTGHLPTYDDVVREQSYQDDSEHFRARIRYQQHEQYYNNLE